MRAAFFLENQNSLLFSEQPTFLSAINTAQHLCPGYFNTLRLLHRWPNIVRIFFPGDGDTPVHCAPVSNNGASGVSRGRSDRRHVPPVGVPEGHRVRDGARGGRTQIRGGGFLFPHLTNLILVGVGEKRREWITIV